MISIDGCGPFLNAVVEYILSGDAKKIMMGFHWEYYMHIYWVLSRGHWSLGFTS